METRHIVVECDGVSVLSVNAAGVVVDLRRCCDDSHATATFLDVNSLVGALYSALAALTDDDGIRIRVDAGRGFWRIDVDDDRWQAWRAVRRSATARDLVRAVLGADRLLCATATYRVGHVLRRRVVSDT